MKLTEQLRVIRKKIRKAELRNVEVDLVSLLFDGMRPANQRGAVIKSADGAATYQVRGTSTKFKKEVNGTQGRLYVTLMEPDKKDSQGDTYTAEEIQKACDRFAKGNRMVGRCDKNHNNQPMDDFYIAETYILKAEDKEHFPDTAVGSWVQVIKCEDLQGELWQKVEKGQFNGVSVAGNADHVYTVDPAIAKAMDTLKTELETLRKSMEKGDVNPDGLTKIKELEAELAKLQSMAANDAQTAAIAGLTKAATDLVEMQRQAISKSIKGSEEGGPDGEFTVDGHKYALRSEHAELYKGIAQVGKQVQPMNILNSNNSSLFIDEIVASNPTDTLTDISVLPLIKDEQIDVGQLNDIVLKNTLDGTPTAAAVGTQAISCATGILTGEITLSKDTLEYYREKLGEQKFGAYVEQEIAKKTEKAVRKLLFKGDRASSDADYKGLDGVIKQATAASKVTTIDATDYATWQDRLNQVILGFSDDMLEEKANMVIYMNHRDLQRLQNYLANRATPAGDEFLLTNGKISYSGIPVKGRLLPENYIVAGLPKFIILGYRTDAEMMWQLLGDWKFHCYIRLRAGFTYVDGFVKVYQIAEVTEG